MFVAPAKRTIAAARTRLGILRCILILHTNRKDLGTSAETRSGGKYARVRVIERVPETEADDAASVSDSATALEPAV